MAGGDARRASRRDCAPGLGGCQRARFPLDFSHEWTIMAAPQGTWCGAVLRADSTQRPTRKETPMLFATVYTSRGEGSEEAAKRVQQIYSQWKPPAGSDCNVGSTGCERLIILDGERCYGNCKFLYKKPINRNS